MLYCLAYVIPQIRIISAFMAKILNTSSTILFDDISQMINDGKRRVTSEINYAMVLLYWSIGKRINDEILLGDRAGYGEQIISYLVNIQKMILKMQF